MNLKEAFQAQNKIEDLFQSLESYLSNNDNVMVKKEKHFRSKSANESDEELDVTDYNRKIYDTNKAIKFCLFLISERAQLAKAIHDAKEKLVFDFDSAVDMNKKRREALDLRSQEIDKKAVQLKVSEQEIDKRLKQMQEYIT